MLDQAQIDFYRQNGYLLVKGLLSTDEAKEYRKELHDLIDRIYSTGKGVDATWNGVDNKSTKRLQHCHDVQFYSAAMNRLLCDPRLTDIASALMGTPNVQLHHTKAFIKPPEKGSPFPMHQDAPFFPHAGHSMMAAIFHFDDAPEKKGCLRVMPGSANWGHVLPHIDNGGFYLDKEAYPIEKSTAIPAQAGDALFLAYTVVHGSGMNESNEARTTLLVQMRDPEDRPTKQTHRSKGQGVMLKGVDPTCADIGVAT